MRWLRIGLYTLAGVVTLLLTAVAVLVTIDLGRFKDRIEVLATDMLGRELRIDGELHAYIGASVELYAEDVFLANPAWADDEAFVTVRKIDIAVDVWSLVNGPVEIERLEIQGVRVNIEKNDASDASWIFEGLKAEPDPEETEPIGRLPFILEYAAINDVQVSYNSPAMAEPLLFIADSFLSTIDGDLLRVEVTGSLNGTPLHFQKTTGPIENLLAFENVAVEITGNVGEITLRGSIWIDDLLAPRRPRLEIDIKGPNASYLTDVLSMSPVTTGPLQLSVSIEEHGEDMLASLNGVFGEFDFGVDGRFRDIQELHNIDLDITADGPDIGTIIRLFGGKYDESDPFEVRGRISRAGTEVTIDNVLVVIGSSNLKIDGFFVGIPT
ncbi:MAG: AsmA family protein, partial [Proteobacteria bacterium]|nr:AsmA family protein [Pseudomonadota bacterium]